MAGLGIYGLLRPPSLFASRILCSFKCMYIYLYVYIYVCILDRLYFYIRICIYSEFRSFIYILLLHTCFILFFGVRFHSNPYHERQVPGFLTVVGRFLGLFRFSCPRQA